MPLNPLWWLAGANSEPMKRAASLVREKASPVFTKMAPDIMADTIKSAAAGAIGIPTFATRPTPLPEESLNLALRGTMPALFGLDALQGALDVAAKNRATFSDYLGANELMPSKGPTELQGAMRGIFAGIAPTEAAKLGIKPQGISESMVDLGAPWWAAGAIGTGVEAEAFGIRHIPSLMRNLFAERPLSSTVNAPDLVEKAHAVFGTNPGMPIKDIYASRKAATMRALRSGDAEALKTVNTAWDTIKGTLPLSAEGTRLYSGFPIEELFGKSLIPKSLTQGADEAGARYLKGLAAWVPAIKDLTTGEIVTTPGAGIHGQVLAANPKFDNLIEGQHFERGAVFADGTYGNRAELERRAGIKDEYTPPPEIRMPWDIEQDQGQRYFGIEGTFRGKIEPRFAKPGVLPESPSKISAALQEMSTTYPLLQKLFQNNPNWADELEISFNDKLKEMGEFIPSFDTNKNKIIISPKSHNYDMRSDDARDTAAHEVLHYMLEDKLGSELSKMRMSGLVADAEGNDFLHPVNFQKFVDDLRYVMGNKAGFKAQLDFTGGVSKEAPFSSIQKGINDALASSQKRLDESINNIVKYAGEDVLQDIEPRFLQRKALIKANQLAARRSIIERTARGIFKKAKPAYMQYATPKFLTGAERILTSEGQFTISTMPTDNWILRMPNGKYITPVDSGLGHSDVFYRINPEYRAAVDAFEENDIEELLRKSYDDFTNAGWVRRNPDMSGGQVSSLSDPNVREALEHSLPIDLANNSFVTLYVNDLGPEGGNITFTNINLAEAGGNVNKMINQKLRYQRFGVFKTSETGAPREFSFDKPPDLFEPITMSGTPTEILINSIFKGAAMEAPPQVSFPLVPVEPADVQNEFNFNNRTLPRDYRAIGIGQRFSNPNTYAHHAGYGTEHDILSNAFDRYSIERQHNDVAKEAAYKTIKNALPWFRKAGGTKEMDDLLRAFYFEIGNPEGADLSAFSEPLQKLGQEIINGYKQMFWEENRWRKADGEPLIDYTHGYQYKMYKPEIVRAIKENAIPDPVFTSGFNESLQTDLAFSPAEQRTQFSEQHPDWLWMDPIAAYYKRRELHLREKYLKPALDKVAENAAELKAAGYGFPKDVIRQLNDFIKYTIKQQPLPMNEQLNNSLAMIPWLHSLLGDKPFTGLTNGLLKLQYLGTLWGSLRQYTRNPLQSVHHISMYGVPNALKGFTRMGLGARAEGSLEKELRYPFIGMKKPDKNFLGTIEAIGFAPLQQTDMFNLIHAYETATAWGQSLEHNEGWQKKMDALAKEEKMPVGCYRWTDEDTRREAEWAIQVAQFKYFVTGMPEVFRNQLGKVTGGLYSWPMNYWFTFQRELLYRLMTGRTGWQDSQGIHKPIPTAARGALLSYALISGAMLAMLESAGIDYGSQMFMGTIPQGFNPLTNAFLGILGVAMGSYRLSQNPNDRWAKADLAKAQYQLNRAWKTLIPGSVAMKHVTKIATGQKPWWEAVTYPKRQAAGAPIPTKQRMRSEIFGGENKLPTKGEIFKKRKGFWD